MQCHVLKVMRSHSKYADRIHRTGIYREDTSIASSTNKVKELMRSGAGEVKDEIKGFVILLLRPGIITHCRKLRSLNGHISICEIVQHFCV